MFSTCRGMLRIAADRCEIPVQVDAAENLILWKFSDGTLVLETNGDPVVEGEDGWELVVDVTTKTIRRDELSS